MIKTDDLKWLLVDLDETVATNFGPPTYVLGLPIEGAREAIKKLAKKGWKITIYTARPWADYQEIEDWLDTNKIPHRRIICGKPLGRWIVDDKNIEFKGDWNEVLKKIK